MAAPVVTMQQLIEAGAHFGHQTHRWNPRMKPYIFGARNGIHILDLSQTVPLMARALDFVSATVQRGGKVLFVGTKRQAQEPIAQAARACGQHYVNHRWLGGMLTNWKTISQSIKRFKTLEEKLSGDTAGLTKKEVLQLTRERDKLELSLGGIRDMGGIPDVMFVIDANKEELAIKEANVLGIPVVAILDSNVSPDGIAFPVPANDDASRAVRLYCDAIAAAATKGRQESVVDSGADIGAMEEAPVEEAVVEVAAEEVAIEEPAAVKVLDLHRRFDNRLVSGFLRVGGMTELFNKSQGDVLQSGPGCKIDDPVIWAAARPRADGPGEGRFGRSPIVPLALGGLRGGGHFQQRFGPGNRIRPKAAEPGHSQRKRLGCLGKRPGLFVESVHFAPGGDGISFIDKKIRDEPGQMVRNQPGGGAARSNRQQPEANFRFRDQPHARIPFIQRRNQHIGAYNQHIGDCRGVSEW